MNEDVQGHNSEEEHVYVIPDDDGVEKEMIHVRTFMCDNEPYALFLEKDNPEEAGLILRIVEEDNESYFISIEDDAEWERVIAFYNAEVASSEN